MDGTNLLELALNVDGVSLYHSLTYSLWPVLCYMTGIEPHSVFVVSVFCGKAKLSDVPFHDETVEELNKIWTAGSSKVTFYSVVNRLWEERCFTSNDQSLPDNWSSLPPNELVHSTASQLIIGLLLLKVDDA